MFRILKYLGECICEVGTSLGAVSISCDTGNRSFITHWHLQTYDGANPFHGEI